MATAEHGGVLAGLAMLQLIRPQAGAVVVACNYCFRAADDDTVLTCLWGGVWCCYEVLALTRQAAAAMDFLVDCGVTLWILSTAGVVLVVLRSGSTMWLQVP